jgi:hypothetical protein
MSGTSSGVVRNKFGLRFWIFLRCLALVIAFFLLFTPSFHDRYFGVAKNEAAAVGRLQRINELEKSYVADRRNSGFACKLERLYEPTQNMQTGEWAGYRFEMGSCSSEKVGVVRYQVTAVPLRQWVSGVRAFCTDQSGNLFYDSNGSASACLSTQKPLP